MRDGGLRSWAIVLVLAATAFQAVVGSPIDNSSVASELTPRGAIEETNAGELSAWAVSALAITLIALGAVLLLVGVRGLNTSLGVSTGLLIVFLAWIPMARTGFTEKQPGWTWGVLAVAGLVGLAAGARWWIFGIVGICIAAGTALGLSIVLISADALDSSLLSRCVTTLCGPPDIDSKIPDG